MLDYTRAAIDKTISDIKNTGYIISIGSQSIYICYLIYALFASVGNTVVNAILLALSVGYFIFYLVYFKRDGRRTVTAKRAARRSVRNSRRGGKPSVMPYCNARVASTSKISAESSPNAFAGKLSAAGLPAANAIIRGSVRLLKISRIAEGFMVFNLLEI